MVKIQVYLKNGNVYWYEVENEAKAREHAAEIIETGYRSVDALVKNVVTWWPPHAISKVVMRLDEPSTTSYTDTVKGT